MPLGWQTLNVHNVIKALAYCYCISMISGGNQSPTSFSLFFNFYFYFILRIYF
jgi:hypothetical protein